MAQRIVVRLTSFSASPPTPKHVMNPFPAKHPIALKKEAQTMWIYILSITIVGTLTFPPQPGLAKTAGHSPSKSTTQAASPPSQDMAVLNVALAENVQNREPVGSLNPSISCEKKGQSPDETALPVVDTNVTNQMYFWNTVQSNTDGQLRHIWLMKKNEDWKPMAEVDLRIGKSNSYRTWSSKKFDRKWHRGEWRIEVAKANEPNEVICASYFRVE